MNQIPQWLRSATGALAIALASTGIGLRLSASSLFLGDLFVSLAIAIVGIASSAWLIRRGIGWGWISLLVTAAYPAPVIARHFYA